MDKNQLKEDSEKIANSIQGSEMDKAQSKIREERVGIVGAGSLIGAAEQIARATDSIKEMTVSMGGARSGVSTFSKAANEAQGLSAKGKTLNPNYRSSRRSMNAKKTNKIICAKGLFSLKGKSALAVNHPEPLYGKLNRPIFVNVKTKDGFGYEQKLEKVKIALKKGLIKTA